MLVRMELRHLRYFVAVAEEENVTRAAARLHVSQPTLSRQISDLEDELGVALFEHGARNIRITAVGRVFLEEARAVLQRSQLAVQTVRAVAGGGRGEINVGYSPSPTVELLPRTLRLFHEANPKIRVQLHDLSGSETISGLRSGNLDVALTVQGLPQSMRGVTFEELRRYPLCVAVAAGHPLAKTRKVSLKQLLDEPLIAYTRADYHDYHVMLEQLFALIKRQPKIVEEHDGVTSLIASVAAGRGLALGTEHFASFAGAGVKTIPLVPAPRPILVGVAYLKKTLSVVAKNFIEAARTASKTAA